MLNTDQMIAIALKLAELDELPIDSELTVPGKDIQRVLAGIDMGTAELMLAKQLGYDCVFRHHNLVPKLGHLGRLVAEDHAAKLRKLGVPANIAQKLLARRIRETEILFHGANFDGPRQTAKLLNIPYLGLHTPADLLGERAVEALTDEAEKSKELPSVADIYDAIMTLREFREAPEGQRPVIWVGDRESYAGKVLVDFSGGLAPELDEYKAFIDAGVGTFVCMHMESEIVKALNEDNRCNVICCGHMASDSIGMNIIIDAWEKEGGIEVTRVGGLI